MNAEGIGGNPFMDTPTDEYMADNSLSENCPHCEESMDLSPAVKPPKDPRDHQVWRCTICRTWIVFEENQISPHYLSVVVVH